MFCPTCRLEQPTSHTYCVRCGAELPVDLLTTPRKSARFFAGIKVREDDPSSGFLRVTHYRDSEELHGGSDVVEVATEHVRFSVWVDDRAQCVISLPASEARELVRFLGTELNDHRTATLRRL